MSPQKHTMTRECIFTALQMLMEQKPYEEITITDIAKKAGVSRMSYYRIYKSKDDILIQYFNDIFEECLEQMKDCGIDNRRQFAVLVFETIKDHHQLIEGVFRAKLYELVLGCLIQYCTYLAEHILHENMEDAQIGYWIYAEAGRLGLLIFRWLEQGMPESPEKMAELLMKDFFRKN
ncbi:MAG: TetR/AcrR family transcriptional regulator [Lachnospiraceae bacterium]